MQSKEPNPIQRATRMIYHSRRRVATGLAIALAMVFGYHAFFGQNGITAYAEKRSEDRVLAAEIEKLASENAQLQRHVDRLQSDPDAIEHEARERLHYTRPGEVIYTLDDHAQPGSNKAALPAKGSTNGADSPSPRPSPSPAK